MEYEVDDTEDQILEFINRRERQLLVHSYLYYIKGESLWTDKEFDAIAYGLVTVLKKYPKIAKKAEWAIYFKGWDGKTGFHLPIEHPDIISVAERVWNTAKNREEEQ